MPNHSFVVPSSLLLRGLVHHSRKQGITGVLLNNRRLRVLVFSFLHTFFQGIVFQHPPTPMTWVGRCDALPCPPPPPPPQKSLVLDTLEVTVLSADESLSESKNGATCTFPSIYVYVYVCAEIQNWFYVYAQLVTISIRVMPVNLYTPEKYFSLSRTST